MPKLETGELVPGEIGPFRSTPNGITKPEYVGRPAPSKHTAGDVYDSETISRVRLASRLAAQALEIVGKAIRPGVTTDQLDEIGHDFLMKHDAYPSTLGYRGFPKSLCASINEVICHGIPDDTILEDGDIVNIDIAAYLNGVHGDTNATFLVGNGHHAEVKNLVENTRIATERGIAAAMPGRAVNVIGRTIESYAKRFGYGVVRDFTGHGVGTSFHTGLIIPHYDSAPEYGDIIRPGMIFTVEPMLTLGTHEWEIWKDGWTVVTRDRSWTAQFEHTVLITDNGPEILTKA